MLANGSARGVLDGAWFFGNIAIQKFAERSFANKANACRVFFLGIGQTNFFRNLSHLRFEQLAHREQSLGQLRLVQAVQKVTLVFAVVQAFEQLVQTCCLVLSNACVVTGGNFFCPHLHRMV